MHSCKPSGWSIAIQWRFWRDCRFALTLLGILLAHELGHYFACRHHQHPRQLSVFHSRTHVIGTFGAFILIRSPIRSMRALFDVGASGPLVGFLVALPAMGYGVLHAKVIPALAADGNADLSLA